MLPNIPEDLKQDAWTRNKKKNGQVKHLQLSLNVMVDVNDVQD